jgi:hypothetical protein
MAALRTADAPDVHVFWFTSSAQRAHIGELIVAATEAFVADADRAELITGGSDRAGTRSSVSGTASPSMPPASPT